MNFSDIEKLHQKYSQQVESHSELSFDLVWTHCQIVAKLALNLAQNISTEYEVNIDIIEKGALLHDIGMYICYDEDFNPSIKKHVLDHGVIAAQIAAEHGFSIQVQNICKNHIGIGLTISDLQDESISIPIQNYVPISIEEEIVCYADKFHSKYPKFRTLEKARNSIAKFGEHKGAIFDRFTEKYGVPLNLAELEEEYSDWQKDIQERFNHLS